jgi:hypothetical protein
MSLPKKERNRREESGRFLTPLSDFAQMPKVPFRVDVKDGTLLRRIP